MPIAEVMFKDKDGFHYKYPERSCDRCLKYPCLEKMEILKSNFAKFGCRGWEDVNTFNMWKPKK